MKSIFVVTVFVLFLMTACAQKDTKKVDLAAEKSAVKDVLDNMEQALKSEDMGIFSNIVAHDSDMVNFGTDVSERWVGFDALKSSVEQQFASFDSMQVALHDQVIKVAAGGNVAWFSQVMDWNFKAGGQPVSLNGLRVTGVLEKRDGKWLFVQLHFSVGVSGQSAEY